MLISFHCLGQTCSNLGFDGGSFSGWSIYTGTVSAPNQKTLFNNEVYGWVPAEHKIVSVNDGTDPNISTLPAVPAGKEWAIRIGNMSSGGRYSKISNSFVVDKNLSIIEFQFAMVLTDDLNNRHSDFQKPGFTIELVNEKNEKLDCGFYDVQLKTTNKSYEGFSQQGSIFYRPWTVIAMDASKYVGQKINLVVTVWGCTGRQHPGYAYFTASCKKPEIKQMNQCPDEEGHILLAAPEGFESYIWNNGQTDRVIKVKSDIDKKYSVKAKPISAANQKCSLDFDFKIERSKYVENTDITTCEDQPYIFHGKSYNTTGKYSVSETLLNCDKTFNLNLVVIPIGHINKTFTICEGEKIAYLGKEYSKTDQYEIVETLENGCKNIHLLDLTVTPIAKFSHEVVICAGENYKIGKSVYSKAGAYLDTLLSAAGCRELHTTVLKIENDFAIKISNPQIVEENAVVTVDAQINTPGQYNISWSSKYGLPCDQCFSNTFNTNVSDQYTASIKIDGGKCTSTANTYVTVSCGFDIPDSFTPNADGLNDTFGILGSRCVKNVTHFRVFDRWGLMVYEVDGLNPANYSQFRWDGTYLQKLVPEGHYLLQIDYLNNRDEPKIFKNSLLLVR